MKSRFKPLPTKAAPAAKLSPKELETRAQALYESRDLKHAPRWEQLGNVTQDVWREYVQQGQKP